MILDIIMMTKLKTNIRSKFILNQIRITITPQTRKESKARGNYNPKVLMNILAIQSKEFPQVSSNFHNNFIKSASKVTQNSMQ